MPVSAAWMYVPGYQSRYAPMIDGDLVLAIIAGIIVLAVYAASTRVPPENDTLSDDAIRHITDPYSDQERH